VLLAVSAPVERLPLAASVPVQPPEAVHELEFVELQLSIELPPLAIAVGRALRVAVGRMLTVAVDGALVPPGPVQVSAKAVPVVSAPVDRLPLVPSVPVQPPEAVHEVALVELQVSDELPPLATTPAVAINVAVGTGSTATVAEAGALVPPGPAQVSEYALLALSAPVD
jgi:hypothetical protein